MVDGCSKRESRLLIPDYNRGAPDCKPGGRQQEETIRGIILDCVLIIIANKAVNALLGNI